MNKRTTNWKDFIFENGSYKLVSLFVTLILWVTILGRRDFMLTKDMDVEFLLPPNAVMQSARGERKISVKVSGPRTALKKFAQSPGSITFDLTKSEVDQKNTKIKAVIQVKNIEVPFGVKVVSIDPDAIEVVLSPIPTVTVPEDEEVLNLKDRPEKGKQK
ncbi:MAG: hypothetical protein J0L82_13260 [Deltaproteobacteria bacterium]|jgi:hypothetical protein|nr:hypothetical protein [Deltaproteobacteria bacterium]